MIEASTLARPYAVAAYHFAKEHHQLKAWGQMLANLSCLVQSQQVQLILTMAALDANARLVILQPIVSKFLDIHGVNFFKLLLNQHRLNLAPVIFDLFKTIQAQMEQRVTVVVTTAIELSPAEQSSLIENISQQLQCQLLSSFYVDDAIIAGAVIRVGDIYVVDGSLRTQLMRLKNQFYAASY